MLRSNPRNIRIADIIYIGLIGIMFVLCFRLFSLMAIEPDGKYISDISYYVNLPTSDNKERYRLLGLVFDIIYQLSSKHGITGMVAFIALTVVMIIVTNYLYIKYFTQDTGADRKQAQIASLIGPFMGAMYIPKLHEYFYKKSFASFAWHSPTELAMLCSGTLAIFFFIKMYERSDEGISRKYWILTMLTGALSAYSKPSLILDVICAMIAIFLIELLATPSEKRRPVFKRLVTMGTSLIPSGCLVLLVVKNEFRGIDHAHRGGIDITFGNLLNADHLMISIIAGLAFPLVVWAVNYKLIKTRKYCMPVGVFFMGILQWAPFQETGARASHGNFGWGRDAGCYYLFLTSLAIAINNWNDKECFMKERPIARAIYFIAIGILLLWHVGSQLVYFYLVCTGNHFYR